MAYLDSGKSTTLTLDVWADNSAEDTGSIVLKVKSDETGADAWESILINTHFSEAVPVLYFTPNYVETGMAFDDTVVETVTLVKGGRP